MYLYPKLYTLGNWIVHVVLENRPPKTKSLIIDELELVLAKSEIFWIEKWILHSEIELLERRLSKSKNSGKSDFGWRKYARTILQLCKELFKMKFAVCKPSTIS